MIIYGGISLSEIEHNGNKWSRTVEVDYKPACIVTGYIGRDFNLQVRWKQYSMIVSALNRIADVINKLDPASGEVTE